ncbi:unnamed protein product, partial [Phaeothamnion confervicola]
GGCEACPSINRCPRFAATPFRPDVCLCTHAISHHVVDAPPAAEANLRSAAAEVLHALGRRGIKRLMCLRSTVGTLGVVVPPPRRTLLEALEVPHTPHPSLTAPTEATKTAATTATIITTIATAATMATTRKAVTTADAADCFKGPAFAANLTVGGRALTKHCHRSSCGWWGGIGGGNAAKNAAARAAVMRILDGAVWLSAHTFAGDGGSGCFEVREGEGYGARWSADGRRFRGFLEPPMAGGHEAKWRH